MSLLPWEILAYLQLRPAHQLLTLSNPLYSVSPGKHVDRNNFTTWIMATRYDPAWGQAVTGPKPNKNVLKYYDLLLI